MTRLRGVALPLLLALALGCTVSTPVEAPKAAPAPAIALPPGTSIDAQGVLIGPKGGSLTRAGDFFLETVFSQGGVVEVYAYDASGEPIPVAALHLDRVTLETNRGTITIALKPSETYYLVGYYDPLYYDPFFFGGYAYFRLLYPSVVIIEGLPVAIYEPAYHGGIASSPGHKYPGGYTRVVVPAPKKAGAYPAGRQGGGKPK